MEDSELMSDLIKIGIPSLVALAGIISSSLLTWHGHRQNLLINELEHNRQKS